MFSVFQLIEGDSERLYFDGAEMEAMAELTARRISKEPRPTRLVSRGWIRENLLIRIDRRT